MTISQLATGSLGALALGVLLGCGGAPAAPAPAPAQRAPAAAQRPALDPTDPSAQRATALREGADLLEKAGAALAKGNRNVAEQLFSSAELLVGPEAVAELAGRFRAGAPPRVTTPTVAFDPKSAPQPATIGNSDAEDEEDRVPPPKVEGSLTGVVQIAGVGGARLGLVTLDPIGRRGRSRPPRRRVIEQRGREFAPRLTAISVGSTIAFPNFDTVFHNVFSTSASTPFDLGLYRSGEAREFTFTKEGIIRLGCNLHANMTAYIAVVAAAHYTVTDDAGRFEFRHLQPGKYKLSAWSERSAAPVVQELTISAGKNRAEVQVRDDAPSGPAPDKFGGARG
ncbi:MAG: carboxypeptidase regulatory-like domain-containing protein [Kofleriaceae bacterium]